MLTDPCSTLCVLALRDACGGDYDGVGVRGRHGCADGGHDHDAHGGDDSR